MTDDVNKNTNSVQIGSKDVNETFDLCRQVWEATGWEMPKSSRSRYIFYGTGGYPSVVKTRSKKGESYPLYNSDYLLERLPEPVLLRKRGGVYDASVRKGNRVYPYKEGSTPLIALLRLVLELKKENIL